MSESAFQTALIKFLRSRNAHVFNMIGNAYQQGIPDLYVCHRFWTGWLELKYDKGVLSDLQSFNLRALRERGTEAYVLRKLKTGELHLGDHVESHVIVANSIPAIWSILINGH